MNHRQLGNTGIRVSEIGLGAWQLANPQWGAGDEAEALRIVHASLDCGCNFIDTAPGYSLGNSEKLLGSALAGKRDKAVLCTKFGHDAQGKTDFSATALRPSVEASLSRLRTDRLDVLLLHNPKNDVLAGQAGAPVREEIEKLKKEGKVRAYGASVDTSQNLGLIAAWNGAAASEILFNAFHQEPRKAFATAAARGVGLIVKVPLDSGWLSGKYDAASKFQGVRERWPAELIARRAAMIEKLKALLPPQMSLTEMALKFILSHREISTIVPGAKSVEQVKTNCKAADGNLDAKTVAAIKELWQRELAENPLDW